MENTGNQNPTGEQELLVVSFGTSYNENREKTIGAIEDAMRRAFAQYDVRRAFTSRMVVRHIRERDGLSIDTIEEGLCRAADGGVRRLIIQPTHLMDGYEYAKIRRAAEAYAGRFEKIRIGKPLLSEEEDFRKVIDALADEAARYDDGRTAVCLMGHGTEADSNRVYARLQDMLTEAGHTHIHVATVEATPDIDALLARVQAGPAYRRVVLRPLMIVAGDHANHDMAGDGSDSWKSRFEAAGYETVCLLKGLGECEAIRQLFVEHAAAAAQGL